MTGELAAALAAFQRDLPRVGKDNTATVKSDKGSYKYRYADLAEVSAAVIPALAKHGLAWSTRPTLTESGQFVLEYELMHTSGETQSGAYPLPGGNSSSQALGSAITYARRYSLCAVTGVSPDDDDDGAAAQSATNGAPDVPAEPDWGGERQRLVKAKDRAGLVALWRKAKALRPDDTDLIRGIEGDGAKVLDAKKPTTEKPQVLVTREYLQTKDRRELERHLFALLGEGGVTDATTGRDVRLRILSRLCNVVPVLESSQALVDEELVDVIVTLDRYRIEGRLEAELNAIGADGGP